jgi:hypothetical protein
MHDGVRVHPSQVTASIPTVDALIDERTGHCAAAAVPCCVGGVTKASPLSGPNTKAVARTIGEAWTIVEPGTGEVVGCVCLQPNPTWAAEAEAWSWFASTGWSLMDSDQPSAPPRMAIRTYRVVPSDAIANPRQRTGRFPFLGS